MHQYPFSLVLRSFLTTKLIPKLKEYFEKRDELIKSTVFVLIVPPMDCGVSDNIEKLLPDIEQNFDIDEIRKNFIQQVGSLLNTDKEYMNGFYNYLKTFKTDKPCLSEPPSKGEIALNHCQSILVILDKIFKEFLCALHYEYAIRYYLRKFQHHYVLSSLVMDFIKEQIMRGDWIPIMWVLESIVTGNIHLQLIINYPEFVQSFSRELIDKSYLEKTLKQNFKMDSLQDFYT